MTEFRYTPDGRYLYPWPINKQAKYLITAPSIRAAEYLKLLLEGEWLSVSPDFPTTLHQDGVTTIYQTPENGPVVKFLKRADIEAIEPVLSKAMWRFVVTPVPEPSLALALTRRFEAQLSCSTCQELGIENPQIKALIEAVLGL